MGVSGEVITILEQKIQNIMRIAIKYIRNVNTCEIRERNMYENNNNSVSVESRVVS